MKQNFKERVNGKNGITLIALIITIIVLLILAGVTIATLTGNNGIITKAQNAKAQNAQKTVEEQINLAVQVSRINEEFVIDKDILERELTNNGIEITKSENDELPWTVKKDGYVYTISENGEVKEKEGIAITTGDIEILKGSTEGKKVSAQILSGETGTIKWESTGNITLRATEGNEVIVDVNSNANAGDTATITAKIEGKTTYQDSINVKIVAEATGLTASKITVGVNRKEKIGGVTTTPGNAEEIEITSYVSQDTTKATVNKTTGEVTGVAIGTTKITITGTGKLSKKQLTGECEVEVTKQLVSVTAQEIAANPKAYYGKKVENYKASAEDTNTYRIFYVNTIANEFGDEAYTIYLKADFKESYNLNSYASYDTTNTKIRTMNPLWAAGKKSTSDTKTRGDSEFEVQSDGTKKVTWNINEQAAAYLCSPINATTYGTTTLPWKSYYKTNDENVNYVIGGPSIEMYVKSYNQVEAYKNAKAEAAKFVLGTDYKTSSNAGYIYKINNKQSTISNDDVYTGTDSIDYSSTYNSMYCGKTTNGTGSKTGYWWLASPSAGSSNGVCHVHGYHAKLFNDDYSSDDGLCPIVSLKSSFTVQIEQ